MSRPRQDYGCQSSDEEEDAISVSDQPTHTGSHLSPLSQYLDNLRSQGGSADENEQMTTPGPAVLVGANLIGTFLDQQQADRNEKMRVFKAGVAKETQEAIKQIPEYVELIKEDVRQARREAATKRYMADRPRRLESMLAKDGSTYGIGIPPNMRNVMRKVLTVKQLDDFVWTEVEDAHRDGRLSQNVLTEPNWENYRARCQEAQNVVDEKYKRWRDLHKNIPLAPMWEDENVTYRVLNRMRKYQDETFYKVTYHSHGIPQFHDTPRAPRFVPPIKDEPRRDFKPCFQCQARGMASRCILRPGGCNACKRHKYRCLSLNPHDIRAVNNGKLKMKQARGWWVMDECPKKSRDEGDLSAEEREDQKKADHWVRWFLKRRWDVLEWVGGERGFVSRNLKRDNWALPSFKKDEDGSPAKDEMGKAIPYDS